MMPAGPLMIEHRLIERMIRLMKKEIERIKQKHQADMLFIDRTIDFIKVYADRCHHGKEENILFRSLFKKDLSPEHGKILNELIEEHAYGRKTTEGLIGAKKRYLEGLKDALFEIAGSLEALVVFYPKHIEKEDKHFFLPCMNYFSAKEQNAMLCEFWEFDKKLIHEKYKAIVEDIESDDR